MPTIAINGKRIEFGRYIGNCCEIQKSGKTMRGLLHEVAQAGTSITFELDRSARRHAGEDHWGESSHDFKHTTGLDHFRVQRTIKGGVLLACQCCGDYVKIFRRGKVPAWKDMPAYLRPWSTEKE